MKFKKNIIDNTFLSENDKKMYLCIYITKKNQTNFIMAKKHNHKTIIPLLTIIIIIVAVAASVWRCSCSCTPEEEKKEEHTVPHINDSISNLRSECEMSHEFDSIMERYLKRWEINGAQLAISRGDSLIYTHGYGWADKERGVQMEPSMIMRIASVSKLVTAIGVMRLCEMGKLRLSEHVFGAQGVLNDTAYTNRIKDKRIFDITIEQLLRHRAGFNNYAGDPMFSTRYIMMQNHLTTPPDNTTLLKIVLKRRLGYTPGTSSCYSNFGYTLLSMIIARRSGMSYEQFIQKNVLQPAGCFDFHIAGNYYADRRQNETKYYMHQGSTPVYEYNNSGRQVEKCYGENDIPRLLGAGAWCASAAELCRLIAAVDLHPGKPDILSKQSILAMTTEAVDHGFSLGWNFTPKNRPWTRTGTLSGTSALVIRYPDNQCWVLLTNTSTWKGHAFSDDTKALFEKLRKKFGGRMPKRDLFV